MPTIEMSQTAYDRVNAFKQVIEGVIEQEIDISECFELVLSQGLDAMLHELLAPLDATMLLHSLDRLAAIYPAQVYSYVAETMRQGANAQGRESIKRRMGFRSANDM